MKKIDWKQKLASRKFWALAAGFVGSLLVVFNVSENGIAQVTAVLTAFGSIAVYILAEGAVDKAAVIASKDSLIESKNEVE